MFYLVGIGLKPDHLTPEAEAAIKQCKEVYLESYTSGYSEGNVKDLEKIVGKKLLEIEKLKDLDKSGKNKAKIKSKKMTKIKNKNLLVVGKNETDNLENKIVLLGRKQVEEEFVKKIKQAKVKNICLLVFGNPLTATTHIQLLIEAKKLKVATKVLPGVSITNYLAKTGLDEYKFGRTTTIVKHSQHYFPESFFDVIEKNVQIGLHTLCLLDIGEKEKGKEIHPISINEAIELLENIEKKRGRKDEKLKQSFPLLSSLESLQIVVGKKEKKQWQLKDALLFAIMAAGSKNEKIVVGKSEEIKKAKFNYFPQSLVVCGKLNDKEKEAIEVLYGRKATA